MRVLTFSTLFPNHERPNFGVFVENRLRHLAATGAVDSTVVAPVAWFPSGNKRFGVWAQQARVARRETRHGLEVHHPRWLAIPKIGSAISPMTLYLASLLAIRALKADGLRFDLIDAHYLYPDGVAAVWLGRAFNCPVVITARGSDVTEFPDHAIPRRYIEGAIAGADALISVSSGLRDRLIELGASPDKVTVLRNGIDTDLFHPVDRAAARAALGLVRPTLISVGGLIPRKRNHLTIDAISLLDNVDLIIVGEGPEQAALQAQIDRLGLGSRVRLLGPRPHGELPCYYGAADAMVLASSREGWANVLLESMACGTPVVASRIPGNLEVVRAPEAGLIMDDNSAEGIARAVRALFANPPDRAATRAYAEKFGWAETSAGQLALFRRLLDRA
jgi:teichuronic acid biosynthesis glycosyltransferase TuaC